MRRFSILDGRVSKFRLQSFASVRDERTVGHPGDGPHKDGAEPSGPGRIGLIDIEGDGATFAPDQGNTGQPAEATQEKGSEMTQQHTQFPTGGRHTPVPHALLVKVRALKAQGMTLQEIASALNQEGVKTPTGRPMTKSNVSNYLIKLKAKRQRGAVKAKRRKARESRQVAAAMPKAKASGFGHHEKIQLVKDILLKKTPAEGRIAAALAILDL